MKIGFFGFNNGPFGQPQVMKPLLHSIEAAGFESAWTGEHVVLIDPQEPPSPVPPEFPMLDTVAALSFAAGVTERLKLGAGIILLAQRNPVVLAKELTSIDVLSGGRLIFGVGVGYVEREFEAIGVPYAERGARTSEHIEAIRVLWTQHKPVFDGRFSRFSGIQQKPMPVQRPHPPVVVGGMSPAGYRRAIAHGDGWFGFNQDEAAAAASIDGLRQAAREAGSPERFDRLEITITPRGPMTMERLERYEELGVHRLVLLPDRPEASEDALDGARRFVDQSAQALIR